MIVAVAGRGNDLAINSNGRKKPSTIFKFQDEVALFKDFGEGSFLSFMKIIQGLDEINLAFEQNKFRSQISEFLNQSGVIGMEVRYKNVFDVCRRDAFAL